MLRSVNAAAVAGALPAVEELRHRCQSIAMLDAILCRNRFYRYYTFGVEPDGLTTLLMNNGSGNYFRVSFGAAGVFIWGFDHESDMSPWMRDDAAVWPGVLDDVPAVFPAELAHPLVIGDGFDPPSITYCLWRQHTDDRWYTGNVKYPEQDGAEALLILCDGGPASYVAWANSYFSDVTVDVPAATRVYAHEPLDEDTVGALAPALTLGELVDEAVAIGYPICFAS